MECEMNIYKDSVDNENHSIRVKDTTIRKYYLTNSKNNNYIAIVQDSDSLSYKMTFKDEKGIISDVKISKSDLKSAEFINFECKHVNRYWNYFKNKKKHYGFFNLSDTIINGERYSRYKLQSTNPKRAKRKKLGTFYFIIDKETSFHLPILDHPLGYATWKYNRNLPKGMFFEKYFIDHQGKLHSRERVLNYWKIDKKFVIGEDCGYTK